MKDTAIGSAHWHMAQSAHVDHGAQSAKLDETGFRITSLLPMHQQQPGDTYRPHDNSRCPGIEPRCRFVHEDDGCKCQRNRRF